MSINEPKPEQQQQHRIDTDAGHRTPRASEDAPRALSLDFKVPTPLPTTSDEFIRRFGPVTVEIQQVFTAVLMLDSLEPNIVIDCLNGLQKYCRKREDNKEIYVELGGLAPIHKRMFDTHTIIQRMCLKILALVSTVLKTKLYLRDLDLAKDLLTLGDGKDDIIVEYATKALSNLATLHTGRLQIIQNPKGLPTLIKLLTHNDPDVQRNALETIWQISADPLHLSLIAGRSTVGHVLKMVDSEYPPLQAVALLTLERVAQRPEGVFNLEALGATAILARKLTDETMVDLHGHILRIFCHECRNRATCRKFAHLTPVIAEIVERTTDPMAKVNGVELLGRLCCLELVAQGLADSGMPFHILTMLSNEHLDQTVKEACAFLTAQIARSAYSSKKDFARCIPALLAMVRKSNVTKRGVERCLIAVSSILQDILSSIDEFKKAKGFQVLYKLLENHDKYSDDAILTALHIIDTISVNPAQRATVIGFNFLPILLKLLEQLSDPNHTEEHQQRQHQQHQKPVQHRKKEKKRSEHTLEISPESAETTEETPSSDGMGGHHHPESSSSPVIKQSSFIKSADRVQHRPYSNPQIQTATSSVLCSILCDPVTHNEFIELKGPEVVMTMIGHDEFPVVSAAVSIINITCTNSILGRKMLDKGLVQTMWKRSDLIGMNGPLRAAFDRAISSNLSLKYSITGHLSPFECLENGFYDMGGLKRLDQLRFPHEFKWDGNGRDHPKRIIFLLNVGPLELDAQLLENNESLRTMQEQGQDLRDVIDAIQAQRGIIDSESVLISVIAKAVSNRFGGPLDKWRLTARSEDIEVENIQNQYKSVVVPISFLRVGTYRVRSLVFKALCDLFGVPCSLETGDYRKTWNVVLLRPDERFPRMCPCLDELEKQGENFVYTESLRRYVVDLVFQPGTLLPLGSFEAETYISSS